MAFDPRAEPCHTCGREPDECICGFAPDIPDDVDGLDLNEGYEDWGIYIPEEEDDESVR
jgi:hypothetical protein